MMNPFRLVHVFTFSNFQSLTQNIMSKNKNKKYTKRDKRLMVRSTNPRLQEKMSNQLYKRVYILSRE